MVRPTRRGLFCLMLLLGLPTPAGAQAAPPVVPPSEQPVVTGSSPPALTLEHVIERFLRGNLAIQAARYRVDAARAEQIASRLRPNPGLTLAAENLRVAGPTAFDQLYEVSATYSQPIERSDKQRLRREVGDLGVTVAEVQFADVLRQRVVEVKRAFYDALLARHTVDNAVENQRTFDELTRFNQVRFEEGAIAEAELLKTRLERVKFDTAVTQARLGLRQAVIKILGLLDETDFAQARTVSGDFPFVAQTIDPEEVKQVALTKATSVQLAERTVTLAERRLALERERRVGDVSPFVGLKRVGPDTTLLAGIAIPLPLFDRNQAGIARARAEVNVATAELALARTRVVADVESAYRAWEAARERVLTFQRGLLQQADESRAIALAAYQDGAIELLGLLEAERTRADIRQQYIQALFDYQASLLLFELVVGAELGT